MRFSPSVRAVGRNVFYCVKNKKNHFIFLFLRKISILYNYSV